ncbi:MAG TPA: helix-turn-helix domain-containing protein, partial [Pseudomonadales bacterium]|nr:helix-turn-helix domain-containing protein [Pseudomonadales bacterium]
AARDAQIPALAAEIEAARSVLNSPAARLLARGRERPLRLAQVEALLASKTLVVDACRYVVRANDLIVSLSTRPVLFTLARALGEAWPDDVARDALVTRVFRGKRADESHRARLRVEMGRLRAQLRPLADVRATPGGYVLVPHRARTVAVLLQPVEERYGAVLARLADGEAWSSSALALALGASQRNVQRALDALAQQGKVQSFGRGRARRWLMPPLPGFATTLLLPTPLPTD